MKTALSILSLKRLLLALVSWRVVGHLLHFEVLSTIYSALVQPYFEYCSVVWGNCNKSLATKLQKLQNRTPCILTFSPCDASADNPFISLGWKTLDTQRKIQTAAIVYKSLNDLAPEYLNSLFSCRNEVSSYSLKDSEGKLAIPGHCPVPIMLKTVLPTEVRCRGIVYLLSCGKRELFPLLNTRLQRSILKYVYSQGNHVKQVRLIS